MSETIIKISKKTNISLINTQNVKNNVNYICENIHKPLNPLLKNISEKIIPILPSSNAEFEQIFGFISNSPFIDYKKFKEYTNTIHTFSKIMFNNLSFYFTNDHNKEKARQLFNEAYSMLEFANIKSPMIIIWLPINANRDFEYNVINDDTLKQSYDNFGAFTASGVTNHPNNLTVSIITRYEEVDKLMIHELIHAFNLDGSGYHNLNKNFIKQYELAKPKNNYSYDYCIYEMYAELLASYIYLTFLNINDSEKEFKDILYQQILVEIIYSNNIIANLIRLNGLNIDDFIKEPSFKGDICFYEYYYLKAMMYNCYEVKMYKTVKEFKDFYEMVIKDFVKGYGCKNDLLKNTYNNMIVTKNFKYMYF